MRSLLQKFQSQGYLPERRPTLEELGWLLLPVVVAFVLLAFDRYGVEHRFAAFFASDLVANGATANDLSFYAQLWLSGSCLVLMVLIPTLYALMFPANGGNSWALGLKRDHLPIYGVLFLVMLPVIWLAGGRENFMFFYPLYNPDSLQKWLLFELVYLTQFFCVEYFFRGHLLLRLHDRIGYAAIGAMVVPYALIHIYKPFPEAVGSILAGYALGYLAIKIRSIWPGVFLHCGVALAMDFFAMLQSGRLANLM